MTGQNDGARRDDETDRLVLDIQMTENTREEGPEALKQYLHDMLDSAYDELEFNITEVDS